MPNQIEGIACKSNIKARDQFIVTDSGAHHSSSCDSLCEILFYYLGNGQYVVHANSFSSISGWCNSSAQELRVSRAVQCRPVELVESDNTANTQKEINALEGEKSYPARDAAPRARRRHRRLTGRAPALVRRYLQRRRAQAALVPGCD